MGDGGARQQLQRGIVEHFHMPPFDLCNAAMAVAHVFAQTDVRNNNHLRHGGLDCPHGPLDNAVRRIGLLRAFVFLRRNAEKKHAPHPLAPGGGRFLRGLFHRQLGHARHGSHRRAPDDPFADKKRID